MNSIVLISILCLSVVSSAPHREHFDDSLNDNQISLRNVNAAGPIGNLIIKTVVNVVVQSEQFIQGWNFSKSLQENLETVVEAPLLIEGVPAWDPEASVESNLVSGISFLLTIIPLPEMDRSKTIAENVAKLTCNALALVPFPTIPIGMTRAQVEEKLTQSINQVLSHIPGLNVNATLQANVKSYVKEICKSAKGLELLKRVKRYATKCDSQVES